MPKNPTEAQIEASRRNGARSHGPTTPAGKAAALAQLDRSTHGLLTRTVTMTGESRARFAELLAQLMEEYQPANITEVLMVEQLATAAWKIRRIQAFEAFCLSTGVRDMASAVAAFQKAPLRKSGRYEAAAFNQFTRMHRDLLRLRLLRAKAPAALVELPLEPENQEVSDCNA